MQETIKMYYGEIKKCDIETERESESPSSFPVVPITVRDVLIRIHGSLIMVKSIHKRQRKRY